MIRSQRRSWPAARALATASEVFSGAYSLPVFTFPNLAALNCDKKTAARPVVHVSLVRLGFGFNIVCFETSVVDPNSFLRASDSDPQLFFRIRCWIRIFILVF
jgi:hypothetical protein